MSLQRCFFHRPQPFSEKEKRVLCQMKTRIATLVEQEVHFVLREFFKK
jgi:hypothetical protein